MFRERPGVPLSGRSQLLLWALVAVDVMVVAWMLSAGEWLDCNAPVVTLGGHHLVLLWLAVVGFGSLAVIALLTGGFAVAHRGLVLSALVSVVAVAGVLSALLCVVLAVFLLTLLGAAFLGRGTMLLGHLGGRFRR